MNKSKAMVLSGTILITMLLAVSLTSAASTNAVSDRAVTVYWSQSYTDVNCEGAYLEAMADLSKQCRDFGLRLTSHRMNGCDYAYDGDYLRFYTSSASGVCTELGEHASLCTSEERIEGRDASSEYHGSVFHDIYRDGQRVASIRLYDFESTYGGTYNKNERADEETSAAIKTYCSDFRLRN